jgi:hypothetical protein
MTDISYGINTPYDLLGKLNRDAAKLTTPPHPYDIFDFIITAAVLNEWVNKFYKSHPYVVALKKAKSSKNYKELPVEFIEWIERNKSSPVKGIDARLHIQAALAICWHTANASKHYHWTNESKITAIEEKPVVKDCYQYFFTSTEPGIYIEHAGMYYTLNQIKRLLLTFYKELLHAIESTQPPPSPGSQRVPASAT